jgi:hypothetical protein
MMSTTEKKQKEKEAVQEITVFPPGDRQRSRALSVLE